MLELNCSTVRIVWGKSLLKWFQATLLQICIYCLFFKGYCLLNLSNIWSFANHSMASKSYDKVVWMCWIEHIFTGKLHPYLLCIFINDCYGNMQTRIYSRLPCCYGCIQGCIRTVTKMK